jgi:hypothetical protein
LATVHPLQFPVDHLNVEFFLCTFLSDTGAHVSGSDHGHALNGLGHETAESNDAHEGFGALG